MRHTWQGEAGEFICARCRRSISAVVADLQTRGIWTLHPSVRGLTRALACEGRS